MKKLSKTLALFMALFMIALAGCGSGNTASGSSGSSSGGAKEIFFLNFKPEIASIYEEIAKEYEAETGVKVKVVTAASGTYEQTLTSEIAKSDPPTIFQINGPVGYQNWKDYCADLSGTPLYEALSDKSLAVTEGEGVYGIPYVVEGYGIIYNNAIMEKYFALPDKAVSISSAQEINNFAALKAVVEDMTVKKDQLGIQGVFASTSLNMGDQWRWQTHLANLPMYYEFAENEAYDNTILAGLASETIQFKYGPNFQNIFDLYINNSITPKTMLGSKTTSESMAEFALGQVAMVQNGNWAWAEISETEGNVVKAEDIRYLPIYTGMPGEESQGLCVGTENYLAINSQVSAEKQQASVDFLTWLFSSEKGKDYVTNKLGFIAPFTTFEEDERPSDPLAREVLNWTEKDGVSSVPWAFASFPSEEFKNQFGNALLEYAQGSMDWAGVTQTVKDAWASEYAAAHS